MRLSWLAELFGKKKAAQAAPTVVASPSRYRGETAASLKVPASMTRNARPLAIERAPEPEQIIPRRLQAAAAPTGSASSSATVAPIAADASASPPSNVEVSSNAPSVSVPAPRPSRERDDDLVRTTKMAPQEELSLKVSEGLKNLSTLLTSIDEKLTQQQRSTELVADRLQALPRVLEGLVEAERVNLDMLRDLRGSMEKQSEAAHAATEKLGQLPTLVDGIGARIEKQTEAAASVKTSVESVGQSVRGLVDGAQRAQSSLITEFRRGQDEHRQRFEELVERQRKTILIVAAIGAFVVIGIVIVLARMPK